MGSDDNWESELVTSMDLQEKAIFCGNNLDITMALKAWQHRSNHSFSF